MKVRVLVRVRSVLPHEEARGEISTHLTLNQEEGTIGTLTKQGNVSSYQVDEVIADGQPQADVYEAGRLSKLVDAVMRGYHATVFAYGQTGSGKTFTMEGYLYRPAEKGKAPVVDITGTPEERLGVIPRTVDALFAEVARLNAEGGDVTRRVVCSFVQVYREQVLDLLNPATAAQGQGLRGLKLKWSRERDFFVDNLFVEEVSDADAALALFQSGVRHKRMAETRMNAASSRSHCLFTLSVQQVQPGAKNELQAEGKLTLVDLAGSERQQARRPKPAADASPPPPRPLPAPPSVPPPPAAITWQALLELHKESMQDSVDINKSLFTLRKVILALSDASARGGRAPHVAYRDSVLTKLLKHSLGGNCHTLMIACLSPCDAHVEENASTLGAP